MQKAIFKRIPEMPFYIAEPVNQLRVNISLCGKEKKVIMITSSTPNEGKSFVSLNLWKSIAEAGSRVLLMDCDLRNSAFRSEYGLAVEGELHTIADVLSGNCSVENALYETNIPNGYIIPMSAVVPNPSMLLESERMKELIAVMRKNFDYIIVDTPPINTVADGLNLAALCDGTVLVVRSGVTPKKLVMSSFSLLKRTEAPLLGTVLNRIDSDGFSGAYHTRNYSYGKSSYRKYGYKYGYSYGYGQKSGQKKQK